MPEYLAPGVYVEEVDTGSKPIEGVSTSTTGMVGVTERGPVNIPILVTSTGEFTRWFGERLNILDFSNGDDRHCYLPHAVQGFFDNGGKRVYVTRVLDTVGAVNAAVFLFDRGDIGSLQTMLLRGAAELTGTAANPPRLVVLDTMGLNPNDWIRVGDGSQAEYRQLDGAPGTDHTMIATNFPMNRSHQVGDTVEAFTRTTMLSLYTIVGDQEAGAQILTIQGDSLNLATLQADALAGTALVEVSGADGKEYRFLTDVRHITPVTASDSQATVQLDSPLTMAYANASSVQPLDITGVAAAASSVDTAYTAGDRLLFADSNSGFTAADILVVDRTNDDQEARLIGSLEVFTIDNGAYEDYPGGSLVEEVTIDAAGTTLDGLTVALATSMKLHSVDGLMVGEHLLVGPAGPNQDPVAIRAIDAGSLIVTLAGGMLHGHSNTDPVQPALRSLTATASAGSSFLAVDNRLGIIEGDVIKLSDASNTEYLTVTAVPGRATNPVAPDAGNFVVFPPIRNDYSTTAKVELQTAPAIVASTPATVTVLDAAPGETELLTTSATGFAVNDFLRLTTGSGAVFYHQLAIAPVSRVPDTITLQTALLFNHSTGSVVTARKPLFTVQALDAGAWGNRLRISVSDEDPGLVAKTDLTDHGPATRIRLGSLAGVEPGTVLELQDPATDEPIGGLLKVNAINRSTGDIALAGTGLDGPQQAAIVALPPGSFLKAVSREFSLTVYLLRQPDPAMPSRNNTILDAESFRYLSMDPRHSHYIHNVIGDINGPIRQSDRRPDGDSWYIRVHDLAQDLIEPTRTTTLESSRLGPEALIDILPDGREMPARHALYSGDDSIATLTDDDYIGEDNVVPEDRTGLQSLRNVEEISIVGIPGRTSMKIQSALINHCEQARFRFAVLDGPQPPKDTIPDVQALRQNYDTKYAAIYYPWLVIPDPFPTNLARVANYPIPPSGHTLGIYARTDIERGVHKAPANEDVRGIVGLQRVLNKEQQDILNPYPVNINVIRDFRDNNRGIRVYGGRVITSDSDWKYVNVRRLLIFIEASIERGLQWVVFEPNAEPLWARVSRSISNFLTLVWRNGALEGTKPEEAYFVKCDRTTMTQTDIDSGRLICLVGVAPVKPAEYVIIRIGLWTAHADS
ncbi:MAG TPA: phage tail sheath C-terminal domain-containing protein [Anaerolineales bacterium]|nr:phage tail sheath C-terminal domain-containing protein [Anaerolineales bacterium]